MMVAQWMIYSWVTAVLVSAAARAVEAGLRAWGRPVRWVWVSAPLLSLSLPVLALATGGRFPGGVFRVAAPGVSWTGGVGASAAAGVPAGGSSGVLESLASVFLGDAVLAAAWLLATFAAAAWYAGVWRRLAASSRTWRRASVAGRSVLVSRSGGPAAVGLLRPSIVVPEWLLGASECAQSVILMHEVEHVRTRDHALLALAPLPVILFPWNGVLWWQLRRLRLAVELDCDRRVLARGVDVETYASLLLEIAARPRGHVLAASLARPERRPLEARLLAMTPGPLSWRRLRVAGAAAAALVLLAVACETDPPVAPAADEMVSARPLPFGDVGDDVEAGRIRVFVDGRRVGRAELDGLAPSDIASIEVQKRALSAGDGASTPLGGTIFIRTKAVSGERESARAAARERFGEVGAAIAEAPAGTVFVIDGRAATAEEAAAVQPGDIATVEVMRKRRDGLPLAGEIRISTKRGRR